MCEKASSSTPPLRSTQTLPPVPVGCEVRVAPAERAILTRWRRLAGEWCAAGLLVEGRGGPSPHIQGRDAGLAEPGDGLRPGGVTAAVAGGRRQGKMRVDLRARSYLAK